MTSPKGPSIEQRWEWRTFGDAFGAADAAFKAMTSTAVQESDEQYLIAPRSDTVKFRNDVMDVKVLREVNADGLERWEPVLKAAFPLSAADLGTVLAALRVSDPPIDGAGDSLDAFLEAYASPATSVRAVPVHKRRVRYVVNGCTAEVTDVVADGHPTRTIAIESEDAAAVVRSVREVGLAGFINTSYPRGLEAVLDGVPTRCAVIDVGSNSIKFRIAEREPSGAWQTVVDRAEVTRLGEGVGNGGDIGSGGLDRALAAIEDMAAEARRHHVNAIIAAGTAALRAARNAPDVLAAIRSRTGVDVEVVSGEEESRLAYLATQAAVGLPDAALVVFDTGGGSSQFTIGRGAHVDRRFSVPVGAIRYTERFGLAGAVTQAEVDAAMAAISDDLSSIDGLPKSDYLVAMGGAVTNMAAVHHGLATYDPEVVQGTILDAAEVDRQIELYRTQDADARRKIVGLQPNRAEVILAGACIVRTIMTKLGHDSLLVSDRGLRHGVLHDRIG